jgi:retinol-binding protein 3
MSELTPTMRQVIVQDIAHLARDKYIFPEKGLETAQAIQSHLEQGHYDDILSPQEFADRLTSDLRQISGDQHWSVSYDSALTSALYAEPEEVNAEELAQLKEHLCRSNFGIRKIEHLPGNIGYIDLREFSWIGFSGAGETIVAAMQLISHCDALIFDLRRNHGGEVETLQLYVSYFVQPEPKLYDSFYYRPTNETQQFWTMPFVPGQRMPDTTLYILTSGATGSGGEAFAYILKNMRRATVIGEATLGAAHTTDMEIVQEHFQVEFPSGRSISPFTQSDWEGRGVVPDIVAPVEQALEVAHLHALERLFDTCTDDQRKQELAWDLEIARNTYAPFSVDKSTLWRFAGQYGDRLFAIQDGALTYSRQGNSALKLTPLSENRFLYPDTIKFEFNLAEQDIATSVTISYRQDRPTILIARSN